MLAGYDGDIAIDDIEWSPGCGLQKLCGDQEYSCKDPQCIPSFLECNFYKDCSSDENMCGELPWLHLGVVTMVTTNHLSADCDFGNSGMGMCGWQPEILNTWYDAYWEVTDDYYMKVLSWKRSLVTMVT